jgi:hypothetical protein
MDERREEAGEYIRYYVWSGYYNPDGVFDVIDEEVFECDGEDEDWLRNAIRREFRKKRAAERTWPEVTDCDRLDRAFEALRKQGLLAGHRTGYTQQDGLEVITGRYKEAGGKESNLAGYCFYTIQDLEGAMEGDTGLFLAFGHFSGSSRKGVAVGCQLREVFERFGFTVVWDGSIKARLLLSGFRWQRRSPGP